LIWFDYFPALRSIPILYWCLYKAQKIASRFIGFFLWYSMCVVNAVLQQLLLMSFTVPRFPLYPKFHWNISHFSYKSSWLFFLGGKWRDPCHIRIMNLHFSYNFADPRNLRRFTCNIDEKRQWVIGERKEIGLANSSNLMDLITIHVISSLSISKLIFCSLNHISFKRSDQWYYIIANNGREHHITNKRSSIK